MYHALTPPLYSHSGHWVFMGSFSAIMCLVFVDHCLVLFRPGIVCFSFFFSSFCFSVEFHAFSLTLRLIAGVTCVRNQSFHFHFLPSTPMYQVWLLCCHWEHLPQYYLSFLSTWTALLLSLLLLPWSFPDENMVMMPIGIFGEGLDSTVPTLFSNPRFTLF